MSNTRQRYIVDGGKCGELIRRFDWSTTELGPLKNWPGELLANVNTLLNCPMAIVLITNRGGHLIYNDAYAAFAGPKHPAIMGMNYAEAWPEVADYNRDIVKRVNSGEIISYKEMLLSLKRGRKLEDVYLNLNYSPMYDASGKIIATQATVVEVTDSHQNKARLVTALEEARAQRQAAEEAALINRTITDNASTALFIMDDSFRCTFMNPAAEYMSGFSFKEVSDSGKTLHDLIHHSHVDNTPYDVRDCPVNDAMIRQQITSGNEIFVRKDGSFFPVFFVSSPIPHDDKRSQIILEVRDVTETEQLIELSKAKDDFIAVASHQLRTPATAVKQYLGILMQEYAGPVSPDQLQYLQTTYNANERQLTIIDDLLKTARVDIKGYKLNLLKGNVSQLARAAAADCKSALDSKNQRLTVDLPAKDVTIKFDKLELAICIDNLLENASKYSPAGNDIKLTINEHETYVDINVQDNGVGIAPNDQLAIFEKFTRISNHLSDTVSGSGLGLYWVKRIIDLHGGQVIIKSKLDKGTTFTIRLPK